MKKISTEYVIIGSGGTAVMAANKLLNQGNSVCLVNPFPEFNMDDLLPEDGLCLWKAIYRNATGDEKADLPDLYDKLITGFRELFPGPLEHTGLTKTEHWAILSNTAFHRTATERFESYFFKLERKNWTKNQLRLLTPDHVQHRFENQGIDLSRVSEVSGAIVQQYAIDWNATSTAVILSQYLHTKFQTGLYLGANIKARYGRKLIITHKQEEISIEAKSGVFVFLNGGLVLGVKELLKASSESWLLGIKKRFYEQIYVWFDRPEILPEILNDDLKQPLKTGRPLPLSNTESNTWIELGNVHYHWKYSKGFGTWKTLKGPDGLETIVDEGLRLHSTQHLQSRFRRMERVFRLRWDWKGPQWKKDEHHTYWATGFEGNLWNILETLWNLPHP